MTKKSGLDAHIIKKYSSISTVAATSNCVNDPDKVWASLGAMATMNLASQHLRTKKF